MISIIYKNRAIPVYFELLSKLVSSNLSEQKKLISNIIGLFDNYQVVVLGDREFCSVKLDQWLDTQRCSAVLGRQRGLGGSHGAYKVRTQVPHTDPKP